MRLRRPTDPLSGVMACASVLLRAYQTNIHTHANYKK